MTKAKKTKLPYYTGIFYYIIRPIARIGIWMYYRKIYLSHTERIPKKQPVILAANHPTGFMEPCIMAVFMWRPLYFLVRGDFFRKPIFNFLMRSLNMIPIFRKRDGNFRDLKSNYASFAACYETLSANRTIMIFPEGSAVHEKRLRPIQKGLSRLAFGAIQQDTNIEDVQIVPIGVSYTYSERPRSEVMVSCGHPISVRAVYEESQGDFNVFDRSLRKRLTDAMMDNLVHIENADDAYLVEQLQQIKRVPVTDQSTFPVLGKADDLLLADKSISDKINTAANTEKELLYQEAQPIFQGLKQYRVPLVTLVKEKAPNWLIPIFLFLSAIPVWIGYAFCYIPARLAKNIADKKVKRTEFYSPVMVAAHLGYFLIFYILLFLASLIIGEWRLLGMGFVLGLLSFTSLIWREKLQYFVWRRRLQKVPEQAKIELKKRYRSILQKL